MDSFFIIGAFIFVIITFNLISFLYEKVEKWKEDNKNNIREEATKKALAEANISIETINTYKEKLNKIGYKKQQGGSPFWKSVLSDGIKKYQNLVEECPMCSNGELIVRKGKYGKFLGCTNFPDCRYTQNIDTSLKKYKDDSIQNFIHQFHLAFKQ